MKKNLPALLIPILVSLSSYSNDSTATMPLNKKINFFIISKPQKKFDPATRFNIVRTKIRDLFHKNRFTSIVAASAQKMSSKVERRLVKHKATIGTLWLDSHGMYIKGSIFRIGSDEFNYTSVKDTAVTKTLGRLQPFCTSESNIVIGSCYGGATFKKSSPLSKDTLYMRGDSLIIGLASIFKTASVYGSESWVMTKPGLFKKKSAVAGFPLRKIFRDVVYRPAWEHIGIWNHYSTGTKKIKQIPPPTLDKKGNLSIKLHPYLDKKKRNKKVAKKIQKLEPGLLKV
jgi:hypothetical protein